MSQTNSATQGHVHVLPLPVYLGVGALLLVLTVVTVGVSYIPLGGFNVVVALLIASIKSLLVAFIFMHLLWDNKLMLTIFVTAILFLTIFITLTMFDTMDRGLVNPETKKPIREQAVIYDETGSEAVPPPNQETGGQH